jgi:hypothetical protein
VVLALVVLALVVVALVVVVAALVVVALVVVAALGVVEEVSVVLRAAEVPLRLVVVRQAPFRALGTADEQRFHLHQAPPGHLHQGHPDPQIAPRQHRRASCKAL